MRLVLHYSHADSKVVQYTLPSHIQRYFKTSIFLSLFTFIRLLMVKRPGYTIRLNSTVVADKEQGPKTIQSLGLGLEYAKTAVLHPATL